MAALWVYGINPSGSVLELINNTFRRPCRMSLLTIKSRSAHDSCTVYNGFAHAQTVVHLNVIADSLKPQSPVDWNDVARHVGVAGDCDY